MDEQNVFVNVSDELVKSIDEVRPYSSDCCIYRVPPRLRSVNESAYTPTIVSIGPLHHGTNKSLQMMEETKKRFVKNFTGRPNVSLRECFKIVKEKEKKLRDCYQETFGSEDKDFVNIILVDAIFIVELFLTIYFQRLKLPYERERLLDAKWVLKEVREDLLLLENQLPFSVLEDVWKCASGIPINEIFYSFFNSERGLNLEAEDGLDTINNSTPMHFVDMVRKLYIPLKPRPLGKADPFHTPSVTELRQAGVKFNKVESKNLFDVSFSNEILKIPKWRITDDTEVIFRNLIAFEQCHCGINKSYICHYRRMMNHLIYTAEDVDLLVKKKIIENYVGDSNEVSSMINKLGTGVDMDPNNFYFADIFNGLNMHYEIPRNKWIANLKQNYFNTPWTIISFCAALLLIILTFTQTVFSIISY